MGMIIAAIKWELKPSRKTETIRRIAFYFAILPPILVIISLFIG